MDLYAKYFVLNVYAYIIQFIIHLFSGFINVLMLCSINCLCIV